MFIYIHTKGDTCTICPNDYIVHTFDNPNALSTRPGDSFNTYLIYIQTKGSPSMYLSLPLFSCITKILQSGFNYTLIPFIRIYHECIRLGYKNPSQGYVCFKKATLTQIMDSFSCSTLFLFIYLFFLFI